MKKAIKFIFSFQFSKFLILLETGLIVWLTYHGIHLAYLCIYNDYSGSLSIASSLFPLAYGAYGTSVAFYYNKSKAEQIKKIETFGIEGEIDDSKPTI